MGQSQSHKSQNKKGLFPQLRFKGFDAAWKREKVESKVNSISSGKTKPSANGDYLVYGSTGIIGRSVQYSHNGDYILVARVGANAGLINRVQGKFAVTDNTLVIDLKEEIDVSFFQAFLVHFNLNKLIFGSGQPLITGGLLKSIEFHLPSLPEQQKIAAFLSSVDEKIQQLTRKKEALERYKKGVMQQLFSGKLRFKDENGKAFLKWEEISFDSCIHTISTKPYQIKANEILESGKYIVVDQGQSLIAGYSNRQDCLYTNHPIIVFGDHTTTLKYIDFNFIVGADGTKLLKCSDEILLKFLYYYLSHNNVEQEGYKRHFSILREVKIKRPIGIEQQKIASYLSGIDTKLERVSSQITEAQTFKKGLLQQLFV